MECQEVHSFAEKRTFSYLAASLFERAFSFRVK